MSKALSQGEFRGRVLQSLSDIEGEMVEVKVNLKEHQQTCNSRITQNEKDIIRLNKDISIMARVQMALTLAASAAAGFIGIRK